ncbi:MAG: recombinase family protein [bacterium]|nr:recombinase family protein [bacterium]
MRCAIYARYSSDLQQDRSIVDQIRNCQHLADQRGWTVLKECIFSDRARCLCPRQNFAGPTPPCRYSKSSTIRVRPD